MAPTAIACTAPSSLADATAAGAISGTVTEAAAPHAPIAGIQVCAFARSEGPEEPEQSPCATTGAGGEYTISGLPSGQYAVGFGSPLASHLNYITQYYDGKTNGETADAVAVSAPATTTGIDAQLVVGGEISGTVTDASNGAGVEGAVICAELSTGEGNCELSGAGGVYTLPGLASGSYTVFFFHRGYQLQVYEDKASPAEANPVAVAQGSTTTGIDAALKPRSTAAGPPPEPTGAGGGAKPGTAPPTATKPFAVVLSRRLTVKRRSVYVKIRCEKARCVGWVGLLRRFDQRRLHIVKGFALGSFSIAPGHERTVAMRLLGDKTLPMFVNAHRHPVALRLRMSVRGGNGFEVPVLVR